MRLQRDINRHAKYPANSVDGNTTNRVAVTARIARWVVAGSVIINLVVVACTTETIDTSELDVRDVAAQLASIEADGEAWAAAAIRALDSADAAARIAQEAADDAEAAARAAAATDDAIAHREAAAAQIAAQDAANAAAVAAAAADEVRGSAVDSTAYAAMRVAQRDAVRNMTDRDRANDLRAAEAYAAAAAPYSAEAAADYAEAAAVAREGARRAYGALYSAVAAGRAASEATVRAEVARAAAPGTTTIPTTTTTTDLCKVIGVIGGRRDASECEGYRAIALWICDTAEQEGVPRATVADRWIPRLESAIENANADTMRLAIDHWC